MMSLKIQKRNKTLTTDRRFFTSNNLIKGGPIKGLLICEK